MNNYVSLLIFVELQNEEDNDIEILFLMKCERRGQTKPSLVRYAEGGGGAEDGGVIGGRQGPH